MRSLALFASIVAALLITAPGPQAVAGPRLPVMRLAPMVPRINPGLVGPLNPGRGGRTWKPNFLPFRLIPVPPPPPPRNLFNLDHSFLYQTCWDGSRQLNCPPRPLRSMDLLDL